LEYLDVFSSLSDNFSPYPYQLPFGISFEHTKNQDIVRKFGDTKHKGGGSLPIWIRYEHIGIEFGFQGKVWADAANPIVYIKVFQKTKAEDGGQTECTLCLKSLKAIE
jgi:hypothetical protein